MSDTKTKSLPITGRARPFSREEAGIFNYAISLIVAHGKPESSFIAGRNMGELANAEIGPFRVERMVLSDGPWERTVEIGIAHEGKTVFKASFEQWLRPRRLRELSVACAVPKFIRGEWEAALLRLPLPAKSP